MGFSDRAAAERVGQYNYQKLNLTPKENMESSLRPAKETAYLALVSRHVPKIYSVGNREMYFEYSYISRWHIEHQITKKVLNCILSQQGHIPGWVH